METEVASESMQPTEEIKPRNFFSRLGGVYASPGETFREIGRSPGVLMPIIALIIIGMVSTYLTSLKVNLQEMVIEQIADQQVAQGRMTKEQAEQLRERAASTSTAGTIANAAAGGLILVLVPLIAAAVAKWISTAFLGAQNRFKSVFSVSLYVWTAVGIVSTVLFLVILYFKNPADLNVADIGSLVASNLGAILTGILGDDALPKYVARLLGWVDIFAIWKIALLAIGYSVVSRKLKTATAASWITGIYIVIALIAAGITSIFG